MNDACDFRAFGENGAREKAAAVSEVNLCLRRETAEQSRYYFTIANACEGFQGYGIN